MKRLLLGIVLAGCGGGGTYIPAADGGRALPSDGGRSSGGGPAASYAGTWLFSSGTASSACNGAQPTNTSLVGTRLVISAEGSSQVLVDFSNANGVCTPSFTALQNQAQLDGGQTCHFTSTSSRITATLDSGQLTLSGSSVGIYLRVHTDVSDGSSCDTDTTGVAGKQ